MLSRSQNFTQPLEQGPGIYFNPIGILKITNDYLNVIIPVDIAYIKPHIKNINSTITTALYLCNEIGDNDKVECDNMFQPLKARYSDLTQNYNSISHLISNRSKRSAWFGGIGTMFKTLIGTIDEKQQPHY